MTAPIRIANCSGFYGDRLSAAREMVEGGPIDVLTGDWLAELTMLILFKDRLRNPDGGFAKTFVRQMEQVMGTCLERGIKVVANAGGLNPTGLVGALTEVASGLGLSPTIASVTGDDLLPRLGALREQGHEFDHLDTGEPLGDRGVLTANAYLGGWGIAEALSRGADIVVTGRTTDAAVVIGPAAWHHGWARDDYDALAGALVAGHVIECGCQATGGNYSFFQEVPGLEHPGFPIAEIAQDGSSVITKHESQGGLVSVGTVTAQLLYEIAGPRYLNPDVTARFDTISLAQLAPDRVEITGVRGEAPPATSKVCLNLVGGAKASLTIPLVGLEVEEKADLLVRSLFAALPGGRSAFTSVDVDLVRSDQDDPARNELAVAQLRITLKAADEAALKPVRAALVELALATYPGFYAAPGDSQVYGVYWPALVPSELLTHEVTVGGETTQVLPTLPAGEESAVDATAPAAAAAPAGPTETVPLGRVVGARSGDKGGNANLGVWARSDEAFAWLSGFLTVERLQQLMPEAKELVVERFDLPRLRALNFVVHGLLGEGVASSTRQDPQAKALGEYLRAKHVEVPVSLLAATSS
ncbi:MAG TPA: acyclic terpene utilization AtuA family protein [Mycobacteriales bacterium]|nr:acyclic terpene utilization AtuA family protein [Mycobacteriales bacterium]